MWCMIILLRGYRKADPDGGLPAGARGSGPLLSSLVAITLLGEQISALGALGIAGVVGGVFPDCRWVCLLRAAHDPAARQRPQGHRLRAAHGGRSSPAYGGGWLCRQVLLMSPILIDYMGNFVRVGPVGPDDCCATCPRPARCGWRSGVCFAGGCGQPGGLCAGAGYAMQQAPMSHVAPAREVSMLFAALIGGHLLGEGDRLARVCGAVHCRRRHGAGLRDERCHVFPPLF